MPPRKKKTSKKKVRRRGSSAAVDQVPELTQEPAANVSEIEAKPRGRKKKPPRRAAVVDAPGDQTATQPEEEIITVVEVELRESIFDALAREASRRDMTPGVYAAVLLKLLLKPGSNGHVTVPASGSLVDDDVDDDNDELIEDPEFQAAFERRP